MKRFDWRILLVSITIFIIPPLAIPARGVLAEDITSYVYGFPFSWFTVYFDSRGGKAFLLQALFEPHQGISINFLSAAMNLAILYVAIRAVLIVFWTRRHTYKKSAPEDQPKEEETVSSGTSRESDEQ